MRWLASSRVTHGGGGGGGVCGGMPGGDGEGGLMIYTVLSETMEAGTVPAGAASVFVDPMPRVGATSTATGTGVVSAAPVAQQMWWSLSLRASPDGVGGVGQQMQVAMVPCSQHA